MLINLPKFRLDGIEISEEFFIKMTRDAESFMGHQDISEKFDLEYNRSDIFLEDGDILYLASYVGGRTKQPNEEIDITDKPIKFFQIIVEEK